MNIPFAFFTSGPEDASEPIWKEQKLEENNIEGTSGELWQCVHLSSSDQLRCCRLQCSSPLQQPLLPPLRHGSGRTQFISCTLFNFPLMSMENRTMGGSFLQCLPFPPLHFWPYHTVGRWTYACPGCGADPIYWGAVMVNYQEKLPLLLFSISPILPLSFLAPTSLDLPHHPHIWEVRKINVCSLFM